MCSTAFIVTTANSDNNADDNEGSKQWMMVVADIDKYIKLSILDNDTGMFSEGCGYQS